MKAGGSAFRRPMIGSTPVRAQVRHMLAVGEIWFPQAEKRGVGEDRFG